MTKFENTTSLQALTEQELENTAGGIAPFLIGAGIVALLFGQDNYGRVDTLLHVYLVNK